MCYKGIVSDGVAPHMRAENEEGRQFFVDDEQPECSKEEIYKLLKDNRVDVIINYLPVGSEEATRFWAQACLDNKLNFLNCIPVFIASDPEWNQKFVDAELAIIGDDIQSQCGSSIVSSRLHSLLLERGFQVKEHSQINLGGNNDFENMSCKSRLTSKKISKENVIRNQNKVAGVSDKDTFIYAGPSDFIECLQDTKVAHISIRACGYGGYPFELDLKMSVTDSPNSAGVVIDSVRFLRVYQRKKLYGFAEAPCVLYNKTPPNITKYEDARKECDKIALTRFD
jgi:myo-inositol-1-phosphate synthase